ncbi:MAG: protein O-mannosyl-transferase family [Planctomycetota bacterium]
MTLLSHCRDALKFLITLVEFVKTKLAQHYAAVLFGALALYIVSCAPGALWQDSGLIQYRIWHNDIEGFLGLAISHPLFYILAIGIKYIPLGEFAHRVNLVSAIAGAVAIANMFLLVRLWLGKNLPAVVAAATFAVSHTFWRHASIIETYTLWTALFLAELIMLLQYTRTRRVHYLYWLGLLSGLSIAVHMLASIPLICYALFIAFLLAKKEIHTKNLAIIVLLWIVGALPYEYLIVKNIIQTGDLTGTLASAAFGLRWQEAVLNTSLSMGMAKENFLYILLNFPTPNFLLFFVGFFGLFKMSPSRSFRNIVLALTILFFLIAFRYTVPDRYAFFIPFYCLVSIFIGLGMDTMWDQKNLKVPAFLMLLFCIIPVGIYAALPPLAEKMQLNIGTRSDTPYRDDYKYFLRPWKTGYRGAERFANEALDLSENNAVIYADVTTIGPLLYLQEVKEKRPDIKIVSSVVNSKDAPKFNEQSTEQLLTAGPVYVVSPRPGYCPQFLLDSYDFIRAGILWQVVKSEE